MGDLLSLDVVDDLVEPGVIDTDNPGGPGDEEKGQGGTDSQPGSPDAQDKDSLPEKDAKQDDDGNTAY